MEKIKSIFELLKSIFELLKTAVIPILLGIFLIRPTYLGSIIEKCNIEKISAGGLEITKNKLKNEIDKTAEVAGNVTKLKEKVDSLNVIFTSIALNSKDSTVRNKAQDLQKEITSINSSFNKVDSSLIKTMITQEKTLENLTGKAADAVSGWMFVGKASKRDGIWHENEKLTIDKISVSSLANGNQTVRISKDVYLRSGSLDVNGFYSNLPVKKALKSNTIVTSSKIGYTDAIDGGVYVWIYITSN